MTVNKQELTKEERIDQERKRLEVIYSDLDGNKRELLSPLMQNAAFMKIELEDLQEKIKKEGPVEVYTNGANQSGRKQSAAVQSYNQILKSYTNTIKLLTGYIPVKSQKPVVEFKPFVSREKTEEEIAAEYAEQCARDDRVRREIEEASRRQHEEWSRQGRE
jgi:hypothetical protein